MVRKKLGRGRKNRCRFCTKEGCPRPAFVDYKDVQTLKKLCTSQGKLFSRKRSGNCAAFQRAVKDAVSVCVSCLSCHMSANNPAYEASAKRILKVLFAGIAGHFQMAGSISADIDPLQSLLLSGSGPKAWIWSRFNSACSIVVVNTITRPDLSTSQAI